MSNYNYNGFSALQIKAIKGSFSARIKIQDLLNKFEYKDDKSYHQNIANFSSALSKVQDLQNSLKQSFIQSFKQFLTYQENIPIEINFHHLKYQQLNHLVDQWQASLKEPSMIRPSQRLYSIEHRNILFNRIFVEQRQNIEMYFQTLSDKKILKGVDIYQLLVDILSHYYLYQFTADNQTFFQKVNSFNNFLQVVQKFIHSQRRIIIDNKSKDFQYIKLYQFEALVYFWQSTNLELELRSDKRFSNCCKQIQTERHQIMHMIQKEAQTQKESSKSFTLEQTINSTLKQLNKLTQDQIQVEKLEIIQNICQSLRKQKIKLLNIRKNQNKINTNYDQSRRNSSKSKSPPPKYVVLVEQPKQEIQIMQFPFELKNEQIFSSQTQQSQNSISLQKTQRISLRETFGKVQQTIIMSKDLSNSKNHKKSIILTEQELNNFNLQNFQQQSFKITENNRKLLQQKPSRIKNQKNFQYKIQNLSRFTQLNKVPQDKVQKNIVNSRLIQYFEIIFNYYSSQKSMNDQFCMNLQDLTLFFLDIGIIIDDENMPREKNNYLIINNLIKKNLIKNIRKIKGRQFVEIINYMMNQDEDLTFQVIEEFVDFYIKVDKSYGNVKISPQKQQINSSQYQRKTIIQYQNQLNRAKSKKRFKYYEETPKGAAYKGYNFGYRFSQNRKQVSRDNKYPSSRDNLYSQSRRKKHIVPALNLQTLGSQRFSRYF